MLILGIETSCDETAAAVVECPSGGPGVIRSNVVLSQLEEHAPYLGVVPEIAARAHVAQLDGLVARAMSEAEIGFEALDGVAATAGPGLIGGLLVGLTTAKAVSWRHELPLVAVNHLEGHALTPRLTDGLRFPYLLLLVSGGHTQLLAVRGPGDYRRMGTTIDDALGEAFDKVAKLLSLGYPGGPEVEKEALNGDAARFDFPRPLKGDQSCNFSFSGLKTAVRRAAKQLEPLGPQDVQDICASFQLAVTDVLSNRVQRAMQMFKAVHNSAEPTLVIAGGVAANKSIASALNQLAEKEGFNLSVPPQWLCTDNAAMIAWAGGERLALGRSDPFEVSARARWPLDESADPVLGSGKAGSKV